MILVTGASGHIGCTLLRKLLQENKKVRALVLKGEDLSALNGLPVEVVKGDVTDLSSLMPAFQDVDYVYHLAGVVAIGSGKKNILYKVNVGGTKNIIKACFKNNVRRLVYTSSIHAFPEPSDKKLITEVKDFDEREVVGHYGKSKALATKAVLEAVKKGLNAVIVHPTGVIGPYEYNLSNMGQLILDYMNKSLYAYIDGSYDFVDVRDVVSGIILAAEKGRIGENYILSGEEITIEEILDYLEKVTNIKKPKFKIPLWIAKTTAPLSEIYYKILNQKPLYTPYSIYTLTHNSRTSSKKAEEELGYKARPIRDSLLDTVKWLKENFNV